MWEQSQILFNHVYIQISQVVLFENFPSIINDFKKLLLIHFSFKQLNCFFYRNTKFKFDIFMSIFNMGGEKIFRKNKNRKCGFLKLSRTLWNFVSDRNKKSWGNKKIVTFREAERVHFHSTLNFNNSKAKLVIREIKKIRVLFIFSKNTEI